MPEDRPPGRRRRTLGLGAIKFHLFLLLPLLVLGRKLWRTAAAATGTVAVLLAIAFIRYGPEWLHIYRNALRDWRLNPAFYHMANLNGLFHGHPIWIAAAVFVVLLAGFININHRGSLELALAAVLAGGVLIVPHNTISDGLLSFR